MYCPTCGAELRRAERGELACSRTGALLSQSISTALSESFVEDKRTPSSEPLRYAIGRRWHCPACGVSMSHDDGSVQCPNCKRCLNEFIYEIIEFNPHP
jgi:uncharacterized Zn finger protein (UPF0148 family)